MGMLLDILRQPLSFYMLIWRRYKWHFLVFYFVLLSVLFLTLVTKLKGESPVPTRGAAHVVPYEPDPCH
jgi:hypothetical protein